MKLLNTCVIACAFVLASGCTTTAPRAQPQSVKSEIVDAPAKESQADERMRQWLDAKFQAAVKRENIPSLTVGMIKDGEVFDYFSYGEKQRGSGIGVDRKSIYQIASLSKMFTGLITNHLVHNGTLDPNEPTATYLSSVITEHTAANLHGVTLDRLLHHQSGITDKDCSFYRNRVDGEPWLGGYSRGELVSDINKISLVEGAEPKFHYTSCGYSIVGLIDELVTGKSYSTLLGELVTSRYGMSDTTVSLDAEQRARLVVPYRKTDRNRTTQASIFGMGTPASGVYSDIADLLNLLKQHIQAYRAYIDHGAPNDLIMTERTVAGRGIRFGAHLLVIQTPSGRLFLHDGDADGFASLYVFSPEHNTGLVLLTSSGGKWFGDMSIAAITGLMDKAYMKSPTGP